MIPNAFPAKYEVGILPGVREGEFNRLKSCNVLKSPDTEIRLLDLEEI
jgi:hypothetical protein